MSSAFQSTAFQTTAFQSDAGTASAIDAGAWTPEEWRRAQETAEREQAVLDQKRQRALKKQRRLDRLVFKAGDEHIDEESTLIKDIITRKPTAKLKTREQREAEEKKKEAAELAAKRAEKKAAKAAAKERLAEQAAKKAAAAPPSEIGRELRGEPPAPIVVLGPALPELPPPIPKLTPEQEREKALQHAVSVVRDLKQTVLGLHAKQMELQATLERERAERQALEHRLSLAQDERDALELLLAT